MKISSREKIWIIVLIVVAAIVFFIPGEEGVSFNNSQKISKTVLNIMITKFRNIKPFKVVDRKSKSSNNFVLKRNIFQYGNIVPNFNNPSQPQVNKDEKSMLNKENNLNEKQKETAEKNFPLMDFKIIGVIETKSGTKACVIVKGPELFVVREGETFFNNFILKKINKKSVEIGALGLDETKTINLENKGGF